MGIWNSNDSKMIEYLEAERVKLWTNLRSVEEEARILKDESRVLKEALNKKTSDYEAEAKQASKKTVEFKNKSEAAKDLITQNLKQSNEFIIAIITAHDSVKALSSQINEIVDSTKINHNAVVEIYQDIQERKEAIKEQVDELQELFGNQSTYTSNINCLETIATNGQEAYAKIDTLHKSILVKKNEIDRLYYEILGYSEKNVETGEETEVQGLKSKLEESYEELKANLIKAQEDLSEFKRKQVQDSITFANQKEGQFTNTLKRWDEELSSLAKKISDLLPNALTAGLSYAYSEKKEAEINQSQALSTEFRTYIIWLVWISLIPFAVSIVSLINNKPFDKVLLDMPRLVVSILPLYIPVLWIAYSANKNLKLSKRLIEEYTHKEVLSKTFEGLSNQIAVIGNDDISSDLRTRLLYNILEVNSENPGKLITDYDKSDHPLMDALDKSVKLTVAVDKLSKIPGFSKLTDVMEQKSKKLLEEKERQAVAGLNMVTTDKKDAAKKEDEEEEE